jgi:hypothetical protein
MNEGIFFGPTGMISHCSRIETREETTEGPFPEDSKEDTR